MDRGLALRFKGDRTYLHGTDIYNATLRAFAPTGAENIDIVFHRLATRQLAAVDREQLTDTARASAYCTFVSSGAARCIALVETDERVEGRYPYDEAAVVDGMEIDVAQRRGVLRRTPPYSAIEIWVAMVKALHGRVYDSSIKWLFVRGRFPHYVHTLDAREWTVDIVANFHDKLTRSTVSVDGAIAGEIFFSPRSEHAGH